MHMSHRTSAIIAAMGVRCRANKLHEQTNCLSKKWRHRRHVHLCLGPLMPCPLGLVDLVTRSCHTGGDWLSLRGATLAIEPDPTERGSNASQSHSLTWQSSGEDLQAATRQTLCWCDNMTTHLFALIWKWRDSARYLVDSIMWYSMWPTDLYRSTPR